MWKDLGGILRRRKTKKICICAKKNIVFYFMVKLY